MANLRSGKTFDCIYVKSDEANLYACKPSNNFNKDISIQNERDVAETSMQNFLATVSSGVTTSGGNGWNKIYSSPFNEQLLYTRHGPIDKGYNGHQK